MHRTHVENVRTVHPSSSGVAEEGEELSNGDVALATAAVKKKPVVRAATKVGRNEPCPCGSGRKYKHCHGKLT